MNELSAKQLIFAAGPMVIPIIFCSISALTIIINKWKYFNSIKTNTDEIKSEVFALIRENKIKSAVATCEKSMSPTTRVLQAGLLKFGSPPEQIKETLEHAVNLEIPRLEQGLVPLITIANMSPLFGVLGTVTAMAVIFHALQNQSATMPTISHADLARGIWQALLTTIAGLIVAIPSFFVYNYFIERIGITVNELNNLSHQLLNLLTRVDESAENQMTDAHE